MGCDGMEWEGKRWSGMIWVGVEWNRMGWHGMGWDGTESPLCHQSNDRWADGWLISSQNQQIYIFHTTHSSGIGNAARNHPHEGEGLPEQSTCIPLDQMQAAPGVFEKFNRAYAAKHISLWLPHHLSTPHEEQCNMTIISEAVSQSRRGGYVRMKP
eukprot:scaffold121933_cov17-Prasinocladus_malaysianus.AAC.1